MRKLHWVRPRRTSPANSRHQYASSRGRQQEVGMNMKHMCSWKFAIVFVVIYLVKLKRNQDMSFWNKMSGGWGSGSTIKARDSDDLSSHYSAEERVRSDYARNYPELNVYASDELRGLSSEDQERLLKLPKARRVEIYKNRAIKIIQYRY